ncbi:MAG: hypothetical protein K2I06_09400, partial [Ruminococcus sp.]|nr:hypothetical protein [Ruminococcus sp.]
MRRNFAQALKTGGIDIAEEYGKLYDLFYGQDKDGRSLSECISNNFLDFHFRGTCLTLEEFDRKHGFNFEESPRYFNIDYFVSFCEYVWNFVTILPGNYFFRYYDKLFFWKHIEKLVDLIGYQSVQEDGFKIFVPKDNVAIAVSESPLILDDVSYKVIAYHHHSMKGDLEAKKETIRKLADLLEPKRENLKNQNKQLATDLFFMFNNLNIRHNNIS